MRSRYKGACGADCVNRHNAKSISSIAVEVVNPRTNKSSPPSCDDSVEAVEEVSVSAA